MEPPQASRARMERPQGPRWRAGAWEGRDSALEWRNPGAENLIFFPKCLSQGTSVGVIPCTTFLRTVIVAVTGAVGQRHRSILLLTPNYHPVTF